MPESITKRLIERLEKAPKPDRPYEIRDTRLRGFIVRVERSGRAAYVIEYGRGKRITLDQVNVMTLARARALAQEVLAEARKPDSSPASVRSLVHPPTDQVMTLAQFLDEVYLEWAQANRRRGEAEIARIRSRFAEFLDDPLTEVTSWRIEKWRLARRKLGRSLHTINRDLAPLKAALARAVQWGHLAEDPLHGVRLSRADDNSRIRFLDDDEEARLRAALAAREQHKREARERFNVWRRQHGEPALPKYKAGAFVDRLQPLVLLALNTGTRQGELFALRWADLDLVRRQLQVRAAAAKGGRPRTVPLNQEALQVLKTWQGQCDDTGPEDLVFPGKAGEPLTNVAKSWRALLEEARIEGFRWHDLRHSFASKLVMRGVDLNTVRELLGHVDLKMTLRYAHLAPGHLADAVGVLDAPAPAEAETETVQAGG